MNNYKLNTKLNWGILVCGFWIQVTNIASAVAKFAVRRSVQRATKNLELAREVLSEEYLKDLTEMKENMEKL